MVGRWFALMVWLGAALAAGLGGGSASAEPRLALVIGNSAYHEVGVLANPVNDARAMAKALQSTGFAVILRENATKTDMERALIEFGERLPVGGVGLVYFAGHGMQVNGRNFLIPIDARIATEQATRLETIDADTVIEMMGGRARVSILVLDACRNNPFERRFRSATGGLAQMSAPEGTLIAYATAPGRVASDGAGSNGLYTSELLKALAVPGQSIEQVFKQVRAGVSKASQGHQVPWEASSLVGDFYFRPAAVPAPGPAAVDADAMTCAALRTSSSHAAFEEYLRLFPQGQCAGFARVRIAELKPVVVAEPPKPPTPVPQTSEPPPMATPQPIGPLSSVLAAIQQAPPRPAVPPTAPPAETPAAGTVFRDCPDCPEMVVVPPGRFLMGSPDTEKGRDDDEGPQHAVEIRHAFAAGRHEVTFAQWEACVADGGCNGYRPKDQGWGRGNRPVTNVSWDDARAYVAWLARKTSRPYRLLTEAEWEYAARGGTATAFWWGDKAAYNKANCDGCTDKATGRTLPVGSFPPNSFGLHDTTGNVAEWVQDCFSNGYTEASAAGAALERQNCTHRMLRGNDWSYPRETARSAYRRYYMAGERHHTYGIRVGLSLP